jgi:hypothetical protein
MCVDRRAGFPRAERKPEEVGGSKSVVFCGLSFRTAIAATGTNSDRPANPKVYWHLTNRACMRIAFVALPAPGHLNPTTALARQLQSRNHEVVLISLPDPEPYVRAAG